MHFIKHIEKIGAILAIIGCLIVVVKSYCALTSFDEAAYKEINHLTESVYQLDNELNKLNVDVNILHHLANTK